MQEKQRLNLMKSIEEFEHAKTLTPGGVLGIRRPYNFVEGEYPIYIESGKGGRIKDVDGNEYIDYLCAYGPIILGYREEEVDEAVIDQIREKGFCFSLTQSIQNRLTEKVNKLVPCSQMCIYTKTGSDATSLAIRLARAYTGRTKVLRCGYHGWHDWCVEVKGGIPKKLYEDVYEFHYNDLDEVEQLLKAHGSDTAAIIVTPIGHPLAEKVVEPLPGYLEGMRKLSDEYGAVLIFDEIRTGFRISLGGAQAKYGVTPDMATFGKAIANGYAISLVAGKSQIMKKAEKEVFVSSTFFPNSLAMRAALKTIEIMERDKVLEKIREKGEYFVSELIKIASKHDVAVEISTVPQMPFVTFVKDKEKTYKDKRKDFYTQLIRRNVFLQPYHHGYICYRHTEEDLKYTLNAIDEAFSYIEKKKYTVQD